MKIKKTESPDGQIELQITVPPAKVEDAVRFIDMQLAMQNGVMGQGMEPAELRDEVKKKVGEAYYTSFIDYQVMSYLAPFAITEEKLAIIGPPKIVTTGVKVDVSKPLSFTVTATAKPTFEIEDFSPVKVKLPKLSVDEADIDNQLVLMAESRATYEKDEDRPVKDGDDIVFAMKTIGPDGNEVKTLTTDTRSYKLGEDYLPKEFDDNLIGMKVGETKTFDVTSPLFNMAPGSTPGVNTTFAFTITLKEVQKKIIPAITDKWVEENVPPLKNVPELREEIRKQGLAARAKELENMKSYMAASEFAKRLDAKIDDQYYELTRDDILNTMQQQLQAQGRTIQEYIAQAGGDQQFSMQLMMQTREVLVQGFALDALARHLKLKLEEKDIVETFSLMAPGQEYQARMEFELTGRMYMIEEGAMRNKANKWLVEHAEVEEIEVPQ